MYVSVILDGEQGDFNFQILYVLTRFLSLYIFLLFYFKHVLLFNTFKSVKNLNHDLYSNHFKNCYDVQNWDGDQCWNRHKIDNS